MPIGIRVDYGNGASGSYHYSLSLCVRLNRRMNMFQLVVVATCKSVNVKSSQYTGLIDQPTYQSVSLICTFYPMHEDVDIRISVLAHAIRLQTSYVHKWFTTRINTRIALNVHASLTKHCASGDEDVVPLEALEHALSEILPVGQELFLGVDDSSAESHRLPVLFQHFGHPFLYSKRD